MTKTATQILRERRAKQLDYYHTHKDDPDFKQRRAERDRLRYLKRKEKKGTEEQPTS